MGPFINLGQYEIAGQVTSAGQVSIQEGFIGTSGSLSAQQIVLTTPDGNSVSEQAANVDFAVGLNQKEQVLTIDKLSADAGFGSINVAKATIPMGQNTATPMNVAVSAQDIEPGRPQAVCGAVRILPAADGAGWRRAIADECDARERRIPRLHGRHQDSGFRSDLA